jgi:hypothetical protein
MEMVRRGAVKLAKDEKMVTACLVFDPSISRQLKQTHGEEEDGEEMVYLEEDQMLANDIEKALN